ncbi:hypothetical protein LVJ94_25750 [Pendulispora rubella]|uniref:VCBS repeat-containing protein n=1 Tax=Pendulispora rubella TaxID=2741070 RepID=A0ABZ2LL62_9BACT
MLARSPAPRARHHEPTNQKDQHEHHHESQPAARAEGARRAFRRNLWKRLADVRENDSAARAVFERALADADNALQREYIRYGYPTAPNPRLDAYWDVQQVLAFVLDPRRHPESAAHDQRDGIIDLLNMPNAQREYSVYTPKSVNGAWTLQGRRITTADRQDVRIDFANSENFRMLDANGDGIVDVVLTDGTALRTFFSLGRYPGGDSQYGRVTWTSGTSSSISNEPAAKCLPDDGDPISFADGRSE